MAKRSEEFLINQRYVGDEPAVEKLQNGQHYKAYTWYSYMCTHKDAKEYIVEYLTNKHRPEADKVSSYPENKTPLTLAWLCRMSSRGVIFDDTTQEYFNNTMKQFLANVAAHREEKTEEKTNVVSVQDHIRAKVGNVIAEIDHRIDEKEDVELYNYLTEIELPASLATRISTHYQPILQEMRDGLSGDDDVLEGYRGYTKPQLRKLVEVYQGIVDDAKSFSVSHKKARKTYTKRPKSVDKQIKGVKFQRESTEYKVTSVDPSKIIGAQEVWLFNTKYLSLTVLRAIDRGGFSVKGTTIFKWDEKNSYSKKIGRKTNEILKIVIDGGKRVLNKVMDQINATATEPSGRLGDSTIILKVLKD